MKIGVLGTGAVAQGIATKLSENGHQLKIGSRTGEQTKGKEWVGNLENTSLATHEQAARFGEVIFNCVAGVGVLDALKLAGKENLANKTLIDISNPLDFSKGMPPSLFVCSDDSLAEQIQRVLPTARVVKVLNTMNVEIMVNPSLLPGEHHLFMAGDSEDAKNEVLKILTKDFGWPVASILDLGDISAARGTEAAVLLWVRLWTKFQNHKFNFHIVTDPSIKHQLAKGQELVIYKEGTSPPVLQVEKKTATTALNEEKAQQFETGKKVGIAAGIGAVAIMAVTTALVQIS